MTKPINPFPDGFHTLQPVINVPDIEAVIAFVKKVFDAVETDRFEMPDGTAVHVEIKIGDSILVMGPEQQFYGQRVARVKDKWGNQWVLATQTELVSPEETQKRFAALMDK